jgi:hypothetical protein
MIGRGEARRGEVCLLRTAGVDADAKLLARVASLPSGRRGPLWSAVVELQVLGRDERIGGLEPPRWPRSSAKFGKSLRTTRSILRTFTGSAATTASGRRERALVLGAHRRGDRGRVSKRRYTCVSASSTGALDFVGPSERADRRRAGSSPPTSGRPTSQGTGGWLDYCIPCSDMCSSPKYTRAAHDSGSAAKWRCSESRSRTSSSAAMIID